MYDNIQYPYLPQAYFSLGNRWLKKDMTNDFNQW